MLILLPRPRECQIAIGLIFSYLGVGRALLLHDFDTAVVSFEPVPAQPQVVEGSVIGSFEFCRFERNNSSMRAVHLLIKGRVQGVFYRASAKAAAENLHITGWVKNTPEGHVEVLACGEEGNLRQFVEWRRRGPEQAVVSDVTELPEKPAGDAIKGFSIVR